MARPRNKRPVSVAITLSEYDGRWHGYITVGVKANGTPDVRHRSGRTEDECADKIRKLEDERDAGRLVRARRTPSVATYLVEWLAAAKETGRLRYGTLRSYQTAVEQYLVPNLGGYRLDRLTREHIKAMIGTVTAAVSRQAAAKAHRVLRTALSEAVRDELVHRNVAKLVQGPEFDEEEVEPLSVDEAQRILEVAKGRRNWARWVIALSLGFRQGEALGLAWRRPDKPRLPGDIDLAAGTINVREKIIRKTWEHGCDDPHACGAAPRKSRPRGLHKLKPCPGGCRRHGQPMGILAATAPAAPVRTRKCPPPCPPGCTAHASACPMRKGGGLVSEPPKSRAGVRPAGMPGPLIAALEARKVEQDAERDAALNEWVDTGLVFTTVWGKAIDPRQDWAEWHSILREAGVPPARLQDARHTAATFLLVQGVDLRVVMDLMGWSQASMAKRYQHVVDVLRREAARRMESLLWPAEPVPPPPPIAPPGASVESDTSTDHATEGGAKIIQFRRKAV